MTAPTPQEAVDAAMREGEIRAEVARLAALPPTVYETKRNAAAKQLGVRASVLDKMVKEHKGRAERNADELPHWKAVPSPEPVGTGELLDGIRQTFRKYIVMPRGADTAIALWVLHSWTIDATDISPLLAVVSPTKRCGKTSVLTILSFLAHRAVLASNVSPSAAFRYVDMERISFLIDEGDSFLRDNEELRGIINSGHTKSASFVVRNVEANGEHIPRRFSTWAPKAIALIGKLPDTLEDRSIVVQLQRKPPGASVARLRSRDCEEFATLRSQAARWAADNFGRLVDTDPAVPERLNDRAADNWRPLLAIADLAGGEWPARTHETACLLSGEGHDSAANVRLLGDIQDAFGELDEIGSADLIAMLAADPEKPWAEWNRGKPVTQRQLAGLLRPFGIISETIHPPGQRDLKGYKRVRFEEAWESYLPGQNGREAPSGGSEASKRPNADGTDTSRIFSSVQEALPDGSKNGKLSHSHAGLDAYTDRNPESGPANDFDQENPRAGSQADDRRWDDLEEIPGFLDRRSKTAH